MIKKIATKDLKVGMFVADVGRPWFNHPWKTKSKLLKSREEIIGLLEFGIAEVTVDLSKSEIPEEPEKQTPSAEPKPVAQTAPARPAPKAPPVSNITELEEALPQAQKVYNQALDTSKALVAACRMNKKIELAEVQETVGALVENVSQNRDALLALMKLRKFDDYTYTHSLNVSVLAISAGQSLRLSDADMEILGLGTMFHDLGKTRIPGHILNKPGKLTDSEFTVMRDHAALSGRIIIEQKLQVDDMVIKVAKHHHERIDGSGYPDKLTGDQIPPLVTICGLSDIYDALTADRVYHKGRPPHEAVKFIYTLRGTHFHAEWVDRFVQCVGIYPPGTIVEMSSGEIAVVIEVNHEALAAPTIKLIADPNGQIYSRPKLCQLSSLNENGGLTIKRIIPRTEAGFDPAYYFTIPQAE